MKWCINNKQIITNTKFKHKEIYKFRTISENRKERSIIGYFLLKKNNWKKVQDIKMKIKAEVSSMWK